MKRAVLIKIVILFAHVAQGQEEGETNDDEALKRIQFNTHPYSRENFYSRFLERLQEPQTTKQGPVLFPPSPPPPRPPLVVTSRPLAEQIVKSNLFDDDRINDTIQRIQQYDPLALINSKRPKIGINNNLHKHNLDPLVNREVDLPEHDVNLNGVNIFRPVQLFRNIAAYRQNQDEHRNNPESEEEGLFRNIEALRQNVQGGLFRNNGATREKEQQNRFNVVNNLVKDSENRFNIREQIRTTLAPFWRPMTDVSSTSRPVTYRPGTSRPATPRPVTSRPLFEYRPLDYGESSHRDTYDSENSVVKVTPKPKYPVNNGYYDGYGGNYDVRGTFNEEKKVLPPIYKVLSDHANENLLRITKNRPRQPVAPALYEIEENSSVEDYRGNEVDTDDRYIGKNYEFSYAVKDKKFGDDFSHMQQGTGQATKGEYRVKLPDGRTQIVSYVADENGYKADVRYDDEQAPAQGQVQNYHPDYSNRKVDINSPASNKLDTNNIEISRYHNPDKNVYYNPDANKADTDPYYSSDINNVENNKHDYIDRPDAPFTRYNTKIKPDNHDRVDTANIGAQSYAEYRTGIDDRNRFKIKATSNNLQYVDADYDYYSEQKVKAPIAIGNRGTPAYNRASYVTPTDYLYNNIPINFNHQPTQSIYTTPSSLKLPEDFVKDSISNGYGYSTSPAPQTSNERPGLRHYLDKIGNYFSLT